MPYQINPNKLLLSKWTAQQPENKERHFIVTELIRDEQETIIACELEAVINKNSYQIDWKTLKDDSRWLMGWAWIFKEKYPEKHARDQKKCGQPERFMNSKKRG